MSKHIPQEDTLFNSESFLEAVRSFNQQHWYEAHNQFEDLWHQHFGEPRELLHGIIQIAVAEYHLENGNLKGSVLLMAEGLHHLVQSSSIHSGFDLVLLRDTVKHRLLALQNRSGVDDLAMPRLISSEAT